jgi:membrane-associated phospholipid phosphatase
MIFACYHVDMRRWGPLAVIAVLLLPSPPARADAPLPKLEWDPAWHRVRPWEYVAGPAMVTGALVLRLAVPTADRNWQGGILFDDAVIDAIAVRGEGARHAILTMSDSMFFGAMGFRLVDSVLLPGLLHGSWDISLQMSFIDIEAFAVVAVVLWGSQIFVGRERPFVAVCRSDPEYAAHEDCGATDDWNRSFIAGHPAVGVTAAALTCLHHSHMPLYGGGLGDDLACGLMIAAAAANGLSRILAEKHYTSDVIFGTTLGLLAGYVIPKSLHYGWGTSPDSPEPGGLPAVILPAISGDRIGLFVIGRL